MMSVKIESERLVDLFKRNNFIDNGSRSPTHKEAIFCSFVCVNEVIKAIKTTISHCELRKIDAIEVQSDLEYWKEVKDYLKNIDHE